MKNVIKNLLDAKVDHMDTLISNMESSKTKVDDLLVKVIAGDKKGEDCTSYFNTQKLLVAKSSLMQQDLSKVIREVNLFYSLAKSAGIVDDMKPEFVNRMDYLAEQDDSFYVVDKGELKPKDASIFEILEKRIAETSGGKYPEFLDSLRTSEMYKDAPSEGSTDTEKKSE